MTLLRRPVGANIRQCRVRQKLTQAQLAEQLCVTRQTVSNYESGRSKPDIETLLRIAEVLGVDVIELLYGPSEETLPRKQMTRTVLLLAVLVLGLLLCRWGAYVLRDNCRIYSAVPLFRLAVRPAGLFFLGWSGAKLWNVRKGSRFQPVRWGQTARCVLLVLLLVNAVIVLPYIVFVLRALVLELAQAENIDMTIPPIPVYQSAAFFCMKVQYEFPFLYLLWGAALQIFHKKRGCE